MKGIISSFIIAAGLLIPAVQEAQTPVMLPPRTAREVREEARKAFEKLDQQVAELEKRQQAEFKTFVGAELALFELQLKEGSLTDSSKAAVLDIVRRYADTMLADTLAGAQAKTAQFSNFMSRVRHRFGLKVVTAVDSAGIVAAGPESVQVAQGPARLAPISNIFKARDEADWEKNVGDKNLPKDWWDRTSTWTSKDGKVTFAVGRGTSRDLNFARDKAALDARVRLVRRDTVAPVVSWELAGSQVIRYKQQTEEDWGGWQAFCLVAVPTALLP